VGLVFSDRQIRTGRKGYVDEDRDREGGLKRVMYEEKRDIERDWEGRASDCCCCKWRIIGCLSLSRYCGLGFCLDFTFAGALISGCHLDIVWISMVLSVSRSEILDKAMIS
jgi:hypothetical protein